jgi:hypothetical protein
MLKWRWRGIDAHDSALNSRCHMPESSQRRGIIRILNIDTELRHGSALSGSIHLASLQAITTAAKPQQNQRCDMGPRYILPGLLTPAKTTPSRSLHKYKNSVAQPFLSPPSRRTADKREHAVVSKLEDQCRPQHPPISRCLHSFQPLSLSQLSNPDWQRLDCGSESPWTAALGHSAVRLSGHARSASKAMARVGRITIFKVEDAPDHAWGGDI